MALMQFFNVRIFYESWKSATIGRPTFKLREMRIFEASLESFPQLGNVPVFFNLILRCENV